MKKENKIVAREFTFGCTCSHCDTYQTCGCEFTHIAGPKNFLDQISEVTSWSKSGFVAELRDGSRFEQNSDHEEGRFFGKGESPAEAVEDALDYLEEIDKGINPKATE